MAIGPARGAAAQAAPLAPAAAMATLGAMCGADAPGGSAGLLHGSILDASAHPVGSAAVTIAWHQQRDAQPGGEHAGAGADDPMLGAFSDDLGHWHICGVPLNTPLTVRAAADEGSGRAVATLDTEHRVASVDLSLRAGPAAGDAVESAQTSALVVFSVEDREGDLLGGISLDIAPAKGPARRVFTDSSGRAIVPAVVPGRARVRTLGIGYRPGELFVPLDAGRNTVPLILDAVRIPELATIRVIGGREVLPRHQDFEMRRALGQTTASITAEQIEKRNPADTWQMLVNIPSMRVMAYGPGVGGVFAMSTREQPLVIRRGAGGGTATAPCWYRVMLDGVLLMDQAPDLSVVLPSPSDVYGIEVFAGLATIPVKYNSALIDSQGQATSNSCGLIAIWTK